jgi:hypothetical protein
MTAPAGAQLSDDGNYWWDGNAWQPVSGGGGVATDSGSSGGGTQQGQLSEDGNYRWNGTDWEPVSGAGGGDGGGGQAVDPSQYPNIQAFANAGSIEGWLQYLGLNPSDFQVNSSENEN